jgi:hypothetical protein
MPALQYVSIAPIAAGAQDYQVCWIFKASGKPPFYDGKRRVCPAAPSRMSDDD